MFKELMEKRYSVRKFSNIEIEEDKIEAIIQAGINAPTAKNLQPIRIMVIQTKEALEKLNETTECHYGCPMAFAIIANKKECSIRPYDNSPSYQVDASIVTTIMMMQAAELDVGTCWIRHFDPAKFSKLFELSDEYECSAILMAGYPTKDCPISINHTTKRSKQELVIYK